MNSLHQEIEIVDYYPLELQYNDVYPSTQLYCLDPMGIGTSSVESLTSYIMRLSQAHNVSSRILMTVFEPYIQTTYLYHLITRAGNYTSTYYINSSNHIAQDFVSACEAMTGQTNLGQLTLSNWSGIRKRDLIKEKRSWCPVCLHEMKVRGQLYEPLIWNVRTINICLKHKVLLEENCSNCGAKGSLIHVSKVGYCSKCKQFLGRSACWDAETNSIDLHWESWKCKVVEEMIICNDKMINTLTTEKITQLMKNMVQNIANGNRSEFARKLNLGRAMVEQWCRGGHIPEFERLLKFSYYYGVTLVTLLTNFPWQHSDFNTHALQYICKKQIDSVNPQQVRELLRIIIDRNDNPPLSLAQVIREVPYSESVLYYNAREECKVISNKYREYTHEQKMIRMERNYLNVKMATLLLLEQDLPVTSGQIRKELKSKIYYKEFIAILNKVFEELNITPLS